MNKTPINRYYDSHVKRKALIIKTFPSALQPVIATIYFLSAFRARCLGILLMQLTPLISQKTQKKSALKYKGKRKSNLSVCTLGLIS